MNNRSSVLVVTTLLAALAYATWHVAQLPPWLWQALGLVVIMGILAGYVVWGLGVWVWLVVWGKQ